MITKEATIKNLVKSRIQTVVMTRINYYHKRLYIRENPFSVYCGLTGALDAVKFKGNQEVKRISRWRDKMIDHLGGVQEQKDYLNSMADFGTIVHEAIVRMWTNGFLNWEEERSYAYAYFKESSLANNIQPNDIVINQQVFEYCKNCASLMMFLHENVEELYAVESMAFNDEVKIATPVDLVVKLNDKRVVTINIKTSNSVTNSQKEQVAFEKFLWNSSYDMKAHTSGILRPKDWRIKSGKPTYEFITLDTQEEDYLITSALKRLEIARNDPDSTYVNYPSETRVFTGKTKIGEIPEMETKTLEQLYKENELLTI